MRKAARFSLSAQALLTLVSLAVVSFVPSAPVFADDTQSKKSEASSGAKLNEPAPDFSLTDADGKTVKLSDFRGKKVVVVYFYPKDETPGCTKESCTFRDKYDDFKAAGAEVIGISSDSVESHKKFATHQKLPFILLADQKGQVRKLWGVPNAMGIMPGRVTYVVDKNGVIRLVFNSMLDAEKHVAEAVKAVNQLAAK